MVYQEASSDATSTKLFGALLNALVFVVIIVIVTVLFVILYKYRCLKLIYAWLIGSSGMMLMMFGSIIFIYMWKAYNLPMDWITFVFIMWNFTGVGVVSIFWYAPQRWNQGYLVLISAFMAIFFTRLPEWTTWTILAAIALYDVFAVLCPRGPLRILVETAQQRQEPIPALLYNGFVAPLMVNTLNMMGSTDRGEGLLAEDKRPQSVKLGLGDFVFYSVLVGRAAMFNWLTVFTCFIAIITGLFWTLLLLAVFRKALPALPFSIALGIFFFFLSKVFLLPFVLGMGSTAVFV
jgi:presenilin 1